MQTTLRARGISDERLLRAFREVPRDTFCLEEDRDRAFLDETLPLHAGATLSQPTVLAKMLQALEMDPGDRVLEIGSGSGYSTALLCELAGSVRGIELNAELALQARHRLAELGYANAILLAEDGREGDYDHAPYDAIILHCAVPYISPALLDQLAVGARLVAPVGGSEAQRLLLFKADHASARQEKTLGRAQFTTARPPKFDLGDQG
ncbi:MAG: protein-L-isoaspartate O-methyltransferase [Planctomycetes bacterium]|nr:protein-L-isoaspartate O-methyltransferase [Planctomycetota bacterium]